jgi:hypothetical protein
LYFLQSSLAAVCIARDHHQRLAASSNFQGESFSDARCGTGHNQDSI